MTDFNEKEMIEPQHNSYRIYLYIATAVVVIACFYVAWLYISSSRDLGFKIEWCFWESTILWPALSVIGFFLQFIDWQHTSFTEGWVIKDSWGRERFVEDSDIMSVMWGNCLFPLLAHLILIPCVYGAILYYIVMIPLALVNAFIPYIAAAVCVCVPFLFYKISENYEWKSFHLIKLSATLIVFFLFIWLLSLPTSKSFNVKEENPVTSVSNENNGIGQITVKAEMVNVRTGPGANYSIYTQSNGKKLQACKGEAFVVLAIEGKWYKVLLSNGDGGYIKKSLCSKMESLPSIVEDSISQKN